MPGLILGPMLRHVSTTTATVWVEVDRPCTVTVNGNHRQTFCVHGHHYALVDVDGLEPGTAVPYTVELDGERVWPEPDSAFPPSTLRTLPRAGQPLRLAYGSCRMSLEHDARSDAAYGVDVLRTLGHQLATGAAEEEWPNLLLLLGDQVYADEPSPAVSDYIAHRRTPGQLPETEIADFEEYTRLYQLAWSEPVVRWLLSTVSTAMIFDDHDVRDDWNTSQAWREQMARLPWWQQRIVGGLGSYWIYQHLGNLGPDERRSDPYYRQITDAWEASETDHADLVDQMAALFDADPTAYRWSYCRDLGDVRLVMVDSRAGRVLNHGQRRMLDDNENAWLHEMARGDVWHLLIGTSLPYLLPASLHGCEAWNEATCDRAWGSRFARVAERVRQGVDLEHWAAFRGSFEDLASLVRDVAHGRRGSAPETVVFLSGDVHHSYLSQVRLPGARTSVYQAVCSPMRNPMKGVIRSAARFAATALAGRIGGLLARSAGVPRPSLRWDTVRGPWFDNALATLHVDGTQLRTTWLTARRDCEGDPYLDTVASASLGRAAVRQP